MDIFHLQMVVPSLVGIVHSHAIALEGRKHLAHKRFVAAAQIQLIQAVSRRVGVIRQTLVRIQAAPHALFIGAVHERSDDVLDDVV